MILDKLAEHAHARVANDQLGLPFEEMKTQALALPRGDFRFEKALKTAYQENGVAIISEVKKASPSKGVISEAFPYLEIASHYQAVGCTCLSVLTEPKWFLGSDDIFRDIRKQCSLPIIRKDFTIHPYQIYQAKVMGADAVLLICALLDTATISSYLEICDSLGMTALVETHDQSELVSAQEAGARVIGVNNRNLKDFSVDLSNASELRKQLHKDVLFVAESGITTPQDGITLVKGGANALLIGEALMKCQSREGISQFISTLRDGVTC